MSTISHEPDEESFHAILPENVDWERFAGLPSVARLAILVGDVKRAGTYVIRVKMPMGTRVMPQRHPEDRVYTVISGVFHMGLGEEFNETALLTFPPGAVVVLPGGQPHFHFAKSGEFVVQITAMWPVPGFEDTELGVFMEPGGGSWREGSSRGSSSLRP